MCVCVCVCVCHNVLLSLDIFQTCLMWKGWFLVERSDACVLKVFSLCLNVPSMNGLKTFANGINIEIILAFCQDLIYVSHTP